MIKYNYTPLTEWSARRIGRYLYNTQQAQDSNIHAVSEIRTRDPSNQETEDPRLSAQFHLLQKRNQCLLNVMEVNDLQLPLFTSLLNCCNVQVSRPPEFAIAWKTVVSGSQFGTQLCDTAKNATRNYLILPPTFPQLCGRRPESRTINQISK